MVGIGELLLVLLGGCLLSHSPYVFPTWTDVEFSLSCPFHGGRVFACSEVACSLLVELDF